MSLSSPAYLVFLGAVYFAYWPLVRHRTAALALLLGANLFFYAKWHWAYLALVPLAAGGDFLVGWALGRERRSGRRKALIAASVGVNVGLLASLKYLPLLTGSEAWHWSLPLGLSFHAFQSLTYTLDIYRHDAEPTRSWLAHLTAVTLFPTVLAGPIARVPNLLAQLGQGRTKLEAADGGRALFLIGLGFAKKLLIADFLGESLVNRVFDFPALYSGFEVLVGVYAYAFQLYYDFSGYSDIAIGSALLLGLRLPANFHTPYAAESIADFWRRWHISLSSWLRDYLYFSLPGLRSRWKAFTYLNLIVTTTVGGFWHGASWTFLVWGFLHGSALAFTRWAQAVRGGRSPAGSVAPRWGRRLVTFHFVAFCWVFFRAPSLDGAGAVLSRVASMTVSTANLPADAVLVLAIAALVHFRPKDWYERTMNLYVEAPFYVQGAVMVLLLVAIQYVARTGAAPFVYTRF